MARTPENTSDSNIHRMFDGDVQITNPETIDGAVPLTNPETILGNKPLRDPETSAEWLYRRFKDGSAILTKPDAYRIARELEVQAHKLAEVEKMIERVISRLETLKAKP